MNGQSEAEAASSVTLLYSYYRKHYCEILLSPRILQYKSIQNRKSTILLYAMIFHRGYALENFHKVVDYILKTAKEIISRKNYLLPYQHVQGKIPPTFTKFIILNFASMFLGFQQQL